MKFRNVNKIIKLNKQGIQEVIEGEKSCCRFLSLRKSESNRVKPSDYFFKLGHELSVQLDSNYTIDRFDYIN